MTIQQSDLAEAVEKLRVLLDGVAAVPVDRTSSMTGSLNQAIGSLRAGAGAAIAGGIVGSQLLAVFTLLWQAGATFAAVDAVRRQGLGTAAASDLANAVVDGVVLQSLACQCRIVAESEFTSRDQVETCRIVLDAGFDLSLEKASGGFDQVTVRALVSLRAAVMRDLSVRTRPLPKMVTFAFPERRPALWMAQRLYGDGSRYAELANENAAIHPLFMPPTGRALSR